MSNFINIDEMASIFLGMKHETVCEAFAVVLTKLFENGVKISSCGDVPEYIEYDEYGMKKFEFARNIPMVEQITLDFSELIKKHGGK